MDSHFRILESFENRRDAPAPADKSGEFEIVSTASTSILTMMRTGTFAAACVLLYGVIIGSVRCFSPSHRAATSARSRLHHLVSAPLGESRSFSPDYRAGLLRAATSAVEEEDGVRGSKDPPLFEAPFKGIARDYKMRLPLYGSDIKDGLNSQCLAATLFLFFACLAPAVGFGSLFGTVTR